PKIAIIGGGPAGLTLARLLHLSPHPISYTIFELSASPPSRIHNGGTLDLHTNTGLAAIRNCGLWSSFEQHARREGEELIFCDKHYTQLVHLRGGKRDRPEIDRQRLQEVLLDSLPAERIVWGRKVVEVLSDGRIRFEGVEELAGPFDLIIGADGAYSRVRARLHGKTPLYAGVSGYELEIRTPTTTCPDLNARVGRGSFFGSSDRKFLNCQRLGTDALKVRAWFPCPEGEAKQYVSSFGNEKTVLMLLERYKDWAPEITELLRQADPETLRDWTLYELPVPSRWEHKEGLTLVGDAASLATPFSGEGVNKAMTDAMELAELIGKSLDPGEEMTLDEAVRRYEEGMFPRAEEIQVTTLVNKELMFGGTAP
ncbi:hypothetical protein BCR34DRAFT_453270, partial [Clohesyomyces aquaticus]